MKTLFAYRRRGPLAVMAMMMFALIGTAADSKKPAVAPKGKTQVKAPVGSPQEPTPEYKSVFEEAKLDPFFPKSERFGVVHQPGVTNAPPLVPVEQLLLRGILIGREKTASINGKILGEGESAVIKLAKSSITVHVIEIRQRSVLVKIDPDPEPKEIYLRVAP